MSRQGTAWLQSVSFSPSRRQPSGLGSSEPGTSCAPAHRFRALLRDQDRPGFGELFDTVVFTIEYHRLDGLGIMIRVHAAYPPDRTEAVALAFLAARLTRITAAVAHDAMTIAEVDAFWDMLQPITPKGRPT